MPESEFGPPPEARDWHPPADVPEQSPESHRPEEAAEPPVASDTTIVTPPTTETRVVDADEVDRAEENPETEAAEDEDREGQEAALKLEREVRAGLATLHGLLQLDPNMRAGKAPEEAQFNHLVDASGKLAELLVGSRKGLYDALRYDESFRNADLPTFTRRAMDILAVWFHAELMKEALDRSLERRTSGGTTAAQEIADTVPHPSPQEGTGPASAPEEPPGDGDRSAAA